MRQTLLQGANRKQALENTRHANALKLQKVREALKRLRGKESDMVVEIGKVDDELDDAQGELNRTMRQQEVLGTQQQRLTRELGIAAEEFKKARDRYRKRLISYYKDGKVKYIEIIFTSGHASEQGQSWSFMDFVNKIYYLTLLAKRDVEFVRDLRVRREAVDAKKTQVEAKKEEVDENRDVQEEDKKQIVEIKTEKQQTLEEIQKQEDELERQEKALEAENSRIEGELAAMIRSVGGARNLKPRFTGRLGNPICSNQWMVTSGYGYRIHPISGRKQFHGGIDLALRHGAGVCAAADGTVIWAGRKGGYGNALMIAHSQDLVTLYGHGLGFPQGIRAGVSVKKGQLVMYGDSTGLSTGDHLHFTVFKNSAVANPMGFF